MSDARARIHAMFPLDEAATAELDKRLDALIAEVRRTDAAHLLDQRHHHLHRAIFCDGIKFAARLLQRRADENTEKATAPAATATPDFYQVGHTYTEPDGATDWRFRVDHITTHPEDGERTAIGWRHFRSEWDVYAYGDDDFEIHRLVGYIDVTEGGTR
jgi:hypothetical protein